MANGSGKGLSHGVGATRSAVLARVVARMRHGAPPSHETQPAAAQRISRIDRAAFYIVLIAIPAARLAAVVTGNGPAAEDRVAGARWPSVDGDGVVRRRVPRRTD